MNGDMTSRDQAWPKLYRFDHRTGDAHAIPALGRFPSVVREAQPRLVRVSQLIPQARSLRFSFSPQGLTGEFDGAGTPAPNESPTRPGKLEPLLIGGKSFPEKGTTPESGGGLSESGRRSGVTTVSSPSPSSEALHPDACADESCFVHDGRGATPRS